MRKGGEIARTFEGESGGSQLEILAKTVISSECYFLYKRRKFELHKLLFLGSWLESALRLVASHSSRTMILTRCKKHVVYMERKYMGYDSRIVQC